MKSIKACIFASLFLTTFPGAQSRATGDLSAQDPVKINVALGDTENALAFFPSNLEFETGKLYQLTLSNPSKQKHYFSSDRLSRSVYTRKVQVNDTSGNPIAEIKGHVREIEVYPQGTSEWWFVPVKIGSISDLKCTIKGHSEAGMVGTISIR
jgi:uncharacterized cupredoxin-like copper-binding protein